MKARASLPYKWIKRHLGYKRLQLKYPLLNWAGEGRDVLNVTRILLYGEMFLILSVKTGPGCSSHSLLDKDKYTVMHLGLGNSKHENGLGSSEQWASVRRRTWSCWWMKKWTWANNVCLWPRKQSISWAASKEGWPAGRGRRSPTLLCPCEDTPQVLCWALGPSAYQQNGAVVSDQKRPWG